MKEANFPTRQDFWKSLVGEMRSSPLSQDDFAKAKGVSKSSLVKWAKRLESAPKAGVARNRVRRSKQESFVIVESESASRLRAPEPVKIVFASGVAIHLRERPEPEWLSLMMKLIA